MATPILKPDPSTMRHALQSSWHGERLTFAVIFASVIEPMLILHFPPFRAADDVDLEHMAHVGLLAYLDGLAEFPEPVLKAGWAEALAHHRRRDWPTLAEIRDACEALLPKPPPSAAPPARPALGSNGRFAPIRVLFEHGDIADRYMATHVGQRSLRERWGIELWDIIARSGALPDDAELARIRAAGMDRHQRFRDVPQDSMGYRLAQAALERESLLEARCGAQGGAHG